jgi:hypothetical protein
MSALECLERPESPPHMGPSFYDKITAFQFLYFSPTPFSRSLRRILRPAPTVAFAPAASTRVAEEAVQSHVPSEAATSVLLLAAAGSWYCRAYGVDSVSGRGIALHRDAGNGWSRGFSKETPVS